MYQENIIFNILCSIGLLEGKPEQIELVKKAANRALNDNDFVLEQYKAVSLRAILGNLNKENKGRFLKIQKTSLEKTYFELSNNASDGAAFFNDFKAVLSKSEKSNEALLLVLERYATTLAVNEKYNDIALYDFIRLTAAFIVCYERSEKVRMAAGSISGIQTYLYDIISKNAAKLLKGRSFYLQLLSDSVLKLFLEALKVPEFNVIYASGGGFYILVPDYQDIEEDFDKLTNTISKAIYKEHKISLFVETALGDAFDGVRDLNTKWDSLFNQLKQKRNNRLSWNESLKNDFFGFVEDGGEIKRDPITNEEMKKGTEINHNGILMQKITKEQIMLGKDLRQANFWYAADYRGANKTITDPLDFNHYFRPKQEDFQGSSVKSFNNFNDNLPTLLYGGNKFPVFKEVAELEEANSKLKEDEAPYDFGDIKPFDALAQGNGLNRLAILRMDVDGLGSIFSEGMESQSYSLNLARYAAVSRSLDMFFKGYLNTIWKQKDYKDTTIIIYSGGDDIFVVGRWNDTFKLAREIQQEFKNWSCGNLTISGGLAVLPAKFPIMQGAKMAEVAEKAAKKHEINGQAKNSICFLDMALNWETELPLVEKLMTELITFLGKNELSMNLITKIGKYAAARQQYETDLIAYNDKKIIQKPSPKWVWNMVYDFKRYADSCKKDSEAEKFVKTITASMLSNQYNGQTFDKKRHFLDYINLAARWVELEKRTKNI